MNTLKVKVEDKITIEEIIKLKESGLSYREIGTMFGVTKQMIHGLVKRHFSEGSSRKLNNKAISLLKNDFEKSRLTEKEYADKTGLSLYMIQAILSNNVKRIRKESLMKISEVLNMSIKELTCIDEEKPKFLPSNIKDSKDIYKTVAFKNMSTGSSYIYKGHPIDGLVNISKDTANIIKAYRISKGLSVIEFSKVTNLSPSRLSQIENYKALKLKYSTLKKLADVLDVMPEQLIVADKSIDVDINSIDFKIKLNQSIIEKIKYNRKLLNLTQCELANKCEVGQVFFSRIESGHLKSIKSSMFRKVCIILNLDYEVMLNTLSD